MNNSSSELPEHFSDDDMLIALREITIGNIHWSINCSKYPVSLGLVLKLHTGINNKEFSSSTSWVNIGLKHRN